MFGQFYAGMRWTALPLFALLLFLTVFLVVVLRTILLAKRDEIDRLARLPLEDETRGPGPRQGQEGARS
jgi:cytochrome c oxidase cbb3-type subunit 4